MSEFTVRKFGSSPHLPREEEEGQGGAVYTKGSSGNLSLRPQFNSRKDNSEICQMFNEYTFQTVPCKNYDFYQNVASFLDHLPSH